MTENTATVEAPAIQHDLADQIKKAKRAKAKPKAKPATKATTNGKLRKSQLRVLELLAKGGVLTKAKIMDKVFDGNSINLAPIVGASDPADRAKREKAAGYPSLLGLGYVKQHKLDIDGVIEVAYEATPKGKKAVTAGCQDPRLPAPGTTITREYKGETYKVRVDKVGFTYAGDHYDSLTAVAKKIIGSDSEINGFAWFKLTGK